MQHVKDQDVETINAGSEPVLTIFLATEPVRLGTILGAVIE